MSLKSKLKNMSVVTFAAFVFYATVGIVCFAILAVVDFSLIHVGIIGILSLIAAYGLFRNRVWVFWVVIVLFFVATTFSGYTLYHALGENLLLDIFAIIYLVLTWIFTAYTVARRGTLEA